MMKIKKYRLKEIIQEEIGNLNPENQKSSSENCIGCVFPEGEFQKEEVPIASATYMLMGKALDTIHDYRGEMPENVEISKDFEFLHEKLAEIWKMLDEHENLGGGETPPDLLQPIHENIKKGNKK